MELQKVSCLSDGLQLTQGGFAFAHKAFRLFSMSGQFPGVSWVSVPHIPYERMSNLSAINDRLSKQQTLQSLMLGSRLPLFLH